MGTSVLMDESSFKGNWKVIGGDGDSQVYKARHRQWGKDVAVKILGLYDGCSERDLIGEAELILRVDSPYVMKVLGVFRGVPPHCSAMSVGVVMDVMERGSLYALQEKLKPDEPLRWPLVFRLIHQVAEGMEYLHSLTPALVHKDLKPQNILLDKDLNVKISDWFANSVTANRVEGNKTLYFAPPEAFLAPPPGGASPAYDVYSYGILMWTILNPGHSIAKDDVTYKFRPNICKVRGERLKDLLDLMRKCWSQNPKNRGSFTECTAETERLYEMNKPGINDHVDQVKEEQDGVILKEPKRECTAETERLYEMNKPGINDHVDQVKELVMSSTGAQQSPAASAAPLYAGPADVACDFCTGARRHKALMSCLTCLASCCETHLQPHYNVPVLKKHKLVPATNKLQEKMCISHNKLMEVFCRTDQQSICYLCNMDEHKGHDTVSAAAEKAEKQKQLVTSQEEVQQKIQEKKKELKDPRLVLEGLNRSADAAVEASDRIFSEMIVSVERRRAELKQLIRDQQQNEVSQIEALLRPQEQTLEQLERRYAELEELSNTEDIITFIQSFQSLSSSTGSPDSTSVVVCPLRSFTDVTDVVSGLRDQLDNLLTTTWPQISKRVCAVEEPQTRKDFLQYSCPLSLDMNTISKGLSLSEEKRKVTYTLQQQQQPYPDNAERFDGYYPQVLCTEGLSERRYWEVERSGGALIAVCYKDTGRRTPFGENDKSWCLRCSGNVYWFKHNRVWTEVSGPVSSRVGVYLDHKAGTLSFYSVSDTMTLLHTVQTTFTQPLYPGILLGDCGDTAELCKTW